MRPAESSSAAPTWKWENGAWAFSRARSAASTRRSIEPSNLRQQKFQKSDQRAAHHLARFQNLGMIDLPRQDAGRHIRHTGDAEHAHAHVIGYDDFVHGGHADQIGADGPQVTDFGGGLVARSQHS